MKKKTRKNKKEWVPIVAAVVVAILFVCIFLRVETKVLSQYDVASVVTAKTEVEAGTQISKDNVDEIFTVTEMMTEYVIENAVTDPATLVGKVIKCDIHKKEMLSTQDVVDRQRWMEEMNEPIEFTFSATSLSAAVAGTIRGGDEIDIGITYQREDGKPYFESIGRSVYVKEVYSENGTVVPRSDKETTCTMFRVIMEKAEGELLIEKLRTGDEVIVTLPK